LSFPIGIALDISGNLFIADPGNNRVRRVDVKTGFISTFAGNGRSSFTGDGGPAVNAGLNTPASLAIDSSGNPFISEPGNNRNRRVDTGGTIKTVAGNGQFGFGGDGGPATVAALNIFLSPGLAVDGMGNLFISDTSNDRIRRVDAVTGVIKTIAGNGNSNFS